MNNHLPARILVLSAVSTLCFLLPARVGEAAEAESRPPNIVDRVRDFTKPAPMEGDELRQKLAERHNAAISLLEARIDQHRRGVVSLDPVFDAARLLVEAKTDLAENETASMRVLEEALELTKVIENRTRELMVKEIGSKADYQRAHLGRLSIEVQILKAKRAQKR